MYERVEIRGQTSSRNAGCDSLGGSRAGIAISGRRMFVPPLNPKRQPSVSRAAIILLPYRPHVLLAHCCYCCNPSAISATVHSTDSTDVAHRILTVTLVLASARYEGNSISKLQIVIEKNRMEIMTYKQHLFFNIISIQI